MKKLLLASCLLLSFAFSAFAENNASQLERLKEKAHKSGRTERYIEKHMSLPPFFLDRDYEQSIGGDFVFGIDPFAWGVNITYNYWMGDFGLEVTNVEKSKHNLTGQLLFVPGLNFKYFSVSCGAGISFWDKKIDEWTNDENGNIVHKETKQVCRFALKPAIRGFIPINGEEWGFILGVGYNIYPNCTKANDFAFSVGLRFGL